MNYKNEIIEKYYRDLTKTVVTIQCEEFRPAYVNDNYLVSSYGRLFNRKHKYFMNPQIDKDGYIMYFLNYRRYYAHRLVAMTYLYYNPTEMKNLQVNHKDGNKMNNHYSNLEWITCIENIRHAINSNLRTTYCENHPNSKYTDKLIENICILMNDGLSYREIAEKLSISYNKYTEDLMCKIRRGISWKRISEKYPNICINKAKYSKRRKG